MFILHNGIHGSMFLDTRDLMRSCYALFCKVGSSVAHSINRQSRACVSSCTGDFQAKQMIGLSRLMYLIARIAAFHMLHRMAALNDMAVPCAIDGV